MKGKTIVATGATSGIGEVAVLALAGLGARIVFIARDEARAEATMRKLEAKAPGLGHRVHLADLSSMAETRKVGAAIAASEPRIDVLINNAGALFAHRRVTPRGPRTHLRPQPHGLFRADRGAARQARRFGAGANRLHLVGRPPGREPRFRRLAERQRLRRAQGLRPLEARQYPVHPRTRPTSGRHGRDGQLPPSRRRRDPVRRFQRRLGRPFCSQW